jgi:hypothetical protein
MAIFAGDNVVCTAPPPKNVEQVIYQYVIPTYMLESVLGTKFTDTAPTAEKIAGITECRRRVGPTFLTCWRQTQMSVVWGG